jgi:hypothetical protein
VYSYEPRSFQVGGTITLAGLAAAAAFAVYCALWPRAEGRCSAFVWRILPTR